MKAAQSSGVGPAQPVLRVPLASASCFDLWGLDAGAVFTSEPDQASWIRVRVHPWRSGVPGGTEDPGAEGSGGAPWPPRAEEGFWAGRPGQASLVARGWFGSQLITLWSEGKIPGELTPFPQLQDGANHGSSLTALSGEHGGLLLALVIIILSLVKVTLFLGSGNPALQCHLVSRGPDGSCPGRCPAGPRSKGMCSGRAPGQAGSSGAACGFRKHLRAAESNA